MSERATIVLEPLGREIAVERGASLREVLHAYGVEFPCGGRGRCRGCRVRQTRGSVPAGLWIGVLARLADATVFVVEWEATPRPVALDSFRTLKNSGAHIAGVIMQKVNVRKSAAYGYYDEAA